MRSFAVLALTVSALASPQYGAPPPAPTTPSAAAPAAIPSAPTANTPGNVFVNVAPGGNFVFSPNNFTAANGTVVTFFFPGGSTAHSITQSSFADPCTPLAAVNGSGPGFDSGLQLGKQFSITITDDSQPIWFHCKQVTHCGLGMVGAINAPSSGNNTFDAFMAAAVKIGSGETTETDNGPVTGGVNAVATAPPAATFSASASSGSSSGGNTNSNTSAATRTGVSGALGAILASVALVIAYASA